MKAAAKQPLERSPGDDAAESSPWPVRRVRRHDRHVKREAVIRAAARAFNKRGYHNTSIDEIAAALNVTKPTIYYFVVK
jgi:AcrR family transcriptional regulator